MHLYDLVRSEAFNSLAEMEAATRNVFPDVLVQGLLERLWLVEILLKIR